MKKINLILVLLLTFHQSSRPFQFSDYVETITPYITSTCYYIKDNPMAFIVLFFFIFSKLRDRKDYTAPINVPANPTEKL